MNHQQQFDRFLHSIDSELQARTGDPNLTHLDFKEFNFSFEFEIPRDCSRNRIRITRSTQTLHISVTKCSNRIRDLF